MRRRPYWNKRDQEFQELCIRLAEEERKRIKKEQREINRAQNLYGKTPAQYPC